MKMKFVHSLVTWDKCLKNKENKTDTQMTDLKYEINQCRELHFITQIHASKYYGYYKCDKIFTYYVLYLDNRK